MTIARSPVSIFISDSWRILVFPSFEEVQIKWTALLAGNFLCSAFLSDCKFCLWNIFGESMAYLLRGKLYLNIWDLPVLETCEGGSPRGLKVELAATLMGNKLITGPAHSEIGIGHVDLGPCRFMNQAATFHAKWHYLSYGLVALLTCTEDLTVYQSTYQVRADSQRLILCGRELTGKEACGLSDTNTCIASVWRA